MSERISDTVFVHGLELDAEIGVLGHEHGRRQPLVVDIELDVALGPPDEDDLASVYDYRQPAAYARELAGGGHIELVETFAERLAERCLGDPGVHRVLVRVTKPEAIPGARAGIEIVRRRIP